MVASETDHCVHTQALEEGCQVFVSKLLSFVSREVQAIKEVKARTFVPLASPAMKRASWKQPNGSAGKWASPLTSASFSAMRPWLSEWERSARAADPGTFGVPSTSCAG